MQRSGYENATKEMAEYINKSLNDGQKVSVVDVRRNLAGVYRSDTISSQREDNAYFVENIMPLLEKYNAMIDFNQEEMIFYMPYIAAVENHWFTNLYFENYTDAQGNPRKITSYLIVPGEAIDGEPRPYIGDKKELEGYNVEINFTAETLIQIEEPLKQDNTKYFRDMLKAGTEYGTGEGYYIYDGSEEKKDAINYAKALEIYKDPVATEIQKKAAKEIIDEILARDEEKRSKDNSYAEPIEPASREPLDIEKLKSYIFSMLEQMDGRDAKLYLRHLREFFSDWNIEDEGKVALPVYSVEGLGDTAANPSLMGDAVTLSAEDILKVERTVAGEARGEPYEGQVAVAAVIFNRLKAEEYPNTIAEVCTVGQFHGANYEGEISQSVKNAVAEAMTGFDPTRKLNRYNNANPRQIYAQGALWFTAEYERMDNLEKNIWPDFIENNVIMRIEGHFFYSVRDKVVNQYKNFNDFINHKTKPVSNPKTNYEVEQ